MKAHKDTYVTYIPTLAVLPYNTMIYYPQLRSNYFHHYWETWHHFTSSQLLSGLSAGPMFKCSGVAKGVAVRPWRHFYGGGSMRYDVVYKSVLK